MHSGLLVHSGFTRKYGVVLNLYDVSKQGVAVLNWLAQSIHGPRILPSHTSERKLHLIYVNAVMEDTVEISFKPSRRNQRTTEKTKKYTIAKPHDQCPIGLRAIYSTPAPPSDRPTLCALCGAPLPRRDTCMSEMELATRLHLDNKRTALVQRHDVHGYSPLGTRPVCVHCGELCGANNNAPGVDIHERVWASTSYKIETDQEQETNHRKIRQLVRGAPYVKHIVIDTAYDIENAQKKIALVLFPSEPMRVLVGGVDLLPNPFNKGPKEPKRTDDLNVSNALKQVTHPTGDKKDSVVLRFFSDTEPRYLFIYDEKGIYQAHAMWQSTSRIYTDIQLNANSLQTGYQFQNKKKLNEKWHISSFDKKSVRLVCKDGRVTTKQVTKQDFRREFQQYDSIRNMGTLYEWCADVPHCTTHIVCTEACLNQGNRMRKTAIVFYEKIHDLQTQLSCSLPLRIDNILQTIQRKRATPQSLAIQLRCLGHVAWANLRPNPFWKNRQDDFLFLIWDAYLAREFAKQTRSEPFKNIVHFVRDNSEKKKRKRDFLTKLSACISEVDRKSVV